MEQNRWVYDAFVRINRSYFDEQLPWPEIHWEKGTEVPWLGWCYPFKRDAAVIHLHAQLLGSEGSGNPWGVPDSWLGERWAFDVLLHEATHLRVAQLCGDRYHGSSPHDNRFWVSQVDRLAPLLGFGDLLAADVPFQQVELFPYGYRKLTGTAAEHYTSTDPLF